MTSFGKLVNQVEKLVEQMRTIWETDDKRMDRKDKIIEKLVDKVLE